MYSIVSIMPQIVVPMGTNIVPSGTMGEDRDGLSRVMQPGIEVLFIAGSMGGGTAVQDTAKAGRRCLLLCGEIYMRWRNAQKPHTHQNLPKRIRLSALIFKTGCWMSAIGDGCSLNQSIGFFYSVGWSAFNRCDEVFVHYGVTYWIPILFAH